MSQTSWSFKAAVSVEKGLFDNWLAEIQLELSLLSHKEAPTVVI